MSEQSLIVVTGGGREAEYARKLLALLSEREIESVLWTEKEYLSNRPTLSNTVLTVFFGLGSETMTQSKTIRKWSYNLYGCRIGMIGNICIVTAQEKDLPGKEQQEFAFYCEQRSVKHPDVVIPSVAKNIAPIQFVKNKIIDKNVQPIWRAQYSMLVYEFMDKWLDRFIEGKPVEDYSK